MSLPLFVFLCLVFVEASNKTQHNKCHFEIDPKSAKEMKAEYEELQNMLIKAELVFPKNVQVNSTKDTILPTHWMMSMIRSKEEDLFTSWPVDYSLYSFGLLDSRTLKDVKLKVGVSPSSCHVIIGEDETNSGIVAALLNISIKHPNKEHYRVNWCYIREYPGIRHTAWYTMKVYFGFPIRMFGYRCCYQHNDRIRCNDQYNIHWNKYQVLPYYTGIVIFCFFPILLMKCSARAMDSGSNFKDKTRQYEDLDETTCDWLFLKRRGPITVEGLLYGIFGLGTKHPVIASRIRRVIYILCSPLAIYAEICMFQFGWPELVKDLVKARIPFGFSSVVGGISDCSSLFLPMFGGPFVALVLFLVVGIIVLALPRDLGAAMEKGVSSDEHRQRTLLMLNTVQIEELSFKTCVNKKGYHKVYSVMKAYVFMLLNPQFWHFVYKFNQKRWGKFASWLIDYTPSLKILRLLLKLFVFIMFFIFMIIESLLAIVYYGLPVLNFLHTIVNGYTMYLNRQFFDRHIFLKILFRIVSPLLLMFYLFMSCLIFLETFNFFSSIAFFIYLSIIIFPNYSFSFVYSFLMLIFFIYRIINEMEKDYFELHFETIKALKYLNANNSKKIDLSESTKDIRKELTFIGDASVQEHIRENNNMPGIPRELYCFVVRRHRPLHVAVFLALMQICIMVFFVLASNIFVNKCVSPLMTDDRQEIDHVISLLLITILPNIVYNCFTPKINHKVRKRKVRQTVVDYYQMQECSNVE